MGTSYCGDDTEPLPSLHRWVRAGAVGQVISVHDVPLFDGLKTEGGVHDVMQYATVKLCTMSCYFFVHDVMLLVS